MTTIATPIMIHTPIDLQAAVREYERICVRGAGSKPALSTPLPGETLLDLSALSGVNEYDPGEYTFTAQANTPVAEVQAMLAEKGQYLPFDPIFPQSATLAGVVAAGTNGPRRYRYGGVRDFLIGVRFVDGRGELVQGGGKVVKNAAGFDYPKLMVGSLGRLGILTEVTFKVFPEPPAKASLCASYPSVSAGLDALVALTRSQFDIDALDLAPTSGGAHLWVQLAGLVEALPKRLEAVASFLHTAHPSQEIVLFSSQERVPYWEESLAMTWGEAGQSLVKVATTPKQIRKLDPLLAEREVPRRYSSGGTLTWLRWPTETLHLDQLLKSEGLAGVVLTGKAGRPWLGRLPGKGFLARIAHSLDPEGRFGALGLYG